MKKSLAYLLLFVYSMLLLKPVLPTAADLVAHTFWYSQHMATVHFEHGKYHIHYDYMEASKKEASGHSKTQSNRTSFATEYLLSATPETGILATGSPIPHGPYADRYSILRAFQDYPPPRS